MIGHVTRRSLPNYGPPSPPGPVVLSCLVALAAISCGGNPAPADERTSSAEPAALEYAIAIHGGAGKIPRDKPAEEVERFEASLRESLELGRGLLAEGTTALDVVEQVIRRLEDDPLFNAGRGAVFNHEGQHELDASIMDGSTLACGGVAGVTTVRHPITLARHVMQDTRHVLMAGAGAERFADEAGVERVEPAWFSTPRRREALERALKEEREEREHGTVGVVALDREGHLAAGTSTGGLTNKRYGRVGDSPIIGAGTYADDRSCAVSATGRGEEFIRRAIARSIAARVEWDGIEVGTAARELIGTLEPGDGGVIVVGRSGEIALIFNTDGMYRGAADSNGRFEVAIW
jgi:beta-aspartyl-peptidase (threonine type)